MGLTLKDWLQVLGFVSGIGVLVWRSGTLATEVRLGLHSVEKTLEGVDREITIGRESRSKIYAKIDSREKLTSDEFSRVDQTLTKHGTLIGEQDKRIDRIESKA